MSAPLHVPTVQSAQENKITLVAYYPGPWYQEVESQVEASGLFTNFSTGRILGLLARTMGDWNLAATYFETAVDSCRGGGQKPQLAWSCYEYADMLLERNGEGDKAKAKGLLDESLAVSTDLGMRPLMERVLSRQ